MGASLHIRMLCHIYLPQIIITMQPHQHHNLYTAIPSSRDNNKRVYFKVTTSHHCIDIGLQALKSSGELDYNGYSYNQRNKSRFDM